MGGQTSGPTLFALTTASQQILPSREGGARKRTQLMIFPLTAGATVTITKGVVAAVAGTGIVLITNQPYTEATDGGYACWQGEVQGIADMAANVSIVESFEEGK